MVEAAAFESLALIIVTAALLGFASKKLRQPTVIAYIATGLLLGSAGLSVVSGSPATELLSELGLAFLLFLIGIEIRLDEVREILESTVVIAVLQMAVMAVVGYLLAQLLGFATLESLVIAAATMYSSTAVVVKLLADKDEITTLPGKIDVGILLVQDLVVVLLMAVIGAGAASLSGLGASLLEVGLMVAAIGSLSYLSSRYFLPRLFREISRNSHAFFIHGVAWLFVMLTVASHLGISREIGAFFAGLALAQLPYSQELQERVRPLTNFFMAIFFIEIGLGLSPGSIGLYWPEALLASGALIAAKFVSIFLLTDRIKFTPETSFKAALNLSQTSEFSLVLGAVAVSQGLVGQEILGFLGMVAIVTMGTSSYLISYNSRISDAVEHLLERFESGEKQDVELRTVQDHAVVIGYDQLSRNVLRALEDHYSDIVVVDRNPLNTRELSGSDYEYIYGDFRHPEIRKAARLKDAELVISFSPDRLANRKAIEESDRDTTVIAKSDTPKDAAELYEQGAHYVTVKNLLAGEKLSEYIRLYLNDRGLFLEEVESELETIKWGGRDV